MSLNQSKMKIQKQANLYPGRLMLRLTPYLFIFPAVVFFTVFMAIPILETLVLSFSDWTGTSLSNIKFVGFASYITMAKDPVFWAALKNNVLFIIIGIPLSITVSLFLAVLLEQGLPGSSFFRGMFFIPTIISLVIVGVLFTMILSPSLGIVNPLLRQIGLGAFERAWLGDAQTAIFTVIIIGLWAGFGLTMFLFIAGLKGIDQEIYEAAIVDGATPWQSFWKITLPLLWPVMAMVIVLHTIGSFKGFELVYIMTFGGPNHASEVVNTWMYLQAFKYSNASYGSAIAMVVLGITLIVSVIQLKAFRSGSEDSASQ